MNDIRVFGSLARGEVRPGRDIDLLLVVVEGGPGRPRSASWARR
ncbi:MAG: nucleotidyltransferase domain-containing protein [Candidatus Limnocylindria bacterium]